MNDFTPLRPSRSSHHDCAFFAATNEYSHGSQAFNSQPSEALPNAAPPINAMTTESSFAVDVVDFYELIDQPRNATTVQLRSRINELYAEAQVNRDHRNVEKRHQYARLLQWIPPLRSILLHEGKRAKYEVLLQQSQSGETSIDFRTALNDLLGENEFDFGEGESILGIRDAAPAVVAEPEARLSSRLDAVAAAAGEGAARANAVASNAVATNAVATNTVASNAVAASGAFESAPRAAANSNTSDSAARLQNLATKSAAERASDSVATAPYSSASVATSATASSSSMIASPATSSSNETPKTSTSSTRSSATSTKVALNPDVLRERASLSASAAGALVWFIVLLTLRAMLGVESNLAALVGVACTASFVAWRSVRRILMARVPAK